jgi:hypothetical protein
MVVWSGRLFLPRIRIAYGLANLRPTSFVHTHLECRCHINGEFSSADKALTWIPGISRVYLAARNNNLKRVGKYGRGQTTLRY